MTGRAILVKPNGPLPGVGDARMRCSAIPRAISRLNRQFTLWVEEHYNAQPDSVLGMSPMDRYALDRGRVRFPPPNEANDELFFVQEERQVRADNTFSFQSVRFETPCHLPDRTIQDHPDQGEEGREVSRGQGREERDPGREEVIPPFVGRGALARVRASFSFPCCRDGGAEKAVRPKPRPVVAGCKVWAAARQ